MTVALAPDPIREAFRRRAMGALERMAQAASPEMLTEALASPTDTGSLARLLADDAASEALRHLDPLAGAIARGAEARARLIEAAGGLLGADAVGRLLGITRQAVDKRRVAGRLLALRIRGDWHYPAVQFAPDGEASEGLAEVIAAMPEASPWAVLDFLLAPDDALGGRTPLRALQAGDLTGLRRLLAARDADAPG